VFRFFVEHQDTLARKLMSSREREVAAIATSWRDRAISETPAHRFVGESAIRRHPAAKRVLGRIAAICAFCECITAAVSSSP